MFGISGSTWYSQDTTCVFHHISIEVSVYVFTGVAPISQVTHVHDKNSNIQQRSLCDNSDFPLEGTAHKGKNSLPLGANSIL